MSEDEDRQRGVEGLSAFERIMDQMGKLARRGYEDRGTEMGRGPEAPAKDAPRREQGDAGYTAAPRLVPGMPGYRKELEAERERDPVKRVPAGPELVRDAPAPVPPSTAEQMLILKREQLARGVNLAKARTSPERDTRNPVGREYDTPERRDAIQRDLEAKGVDPHLRAVRDLIEKGQGQPPHKAVEHEPDMTGRGVPQGGRDPRNRGTEREQGGRGRTR